MGSLPFFPNIPIDAGLLASSGPMLALLIGAPLAYFGGRLEVRRGSGRPWRMARLVALAAFTAAWLALIAGGSAAPSLDSLSVLMAALALTIGTLVAIYSGAPLAEDEGAEKYYALLLVMVGTLIGLTAARDLFTLWVWFEAMAISSYFLVGFYHEERAALEATIKYLIQSATGSALIVLGIALVLADTGTLSLERLPAVAHGAALLAAGALFVIGFGVKIALVPMHTWLPDAHAQAPSGVSALLSGIIIEGALIALLRVCGGLSTLRPTWGELLIGFGVLNVVCGNLLALRQTQVKRMLAFSSLAHVGYMLFGVGLALYSGQPAGAAGGLFHLLNHGLMKGLAFLTAGAFLYALRFPHGRALTIADLSGAARRYPVAAFAFSVALMGLAGLPPLAGFMSKWQIVVAGFATNNTVIQALVAFVALNSVLSLAYYMPLINALYRQQPAAALNAGRRLPVAMNVPLLLLSAAIVIIGIWPAVLSGLTAPAGAAVVGAIAR